MELKIVIVFTLIFLILLETLAGSVLRMTLIWCDSHLHTPVYFLLSQLSLMDVLYSSTFVPKTTTAFLSGRNSISFINCGIQLFLFVILVGAGCLPLAVTAYDRYAAMRHPAQFS